MHYGELLHYTCVDTPETADMQVSIEGTDMQVHDSAKHSTLRLPLPIGLHQFAEIIYAMDIQRAAALYPIGTTGYMLECERRAITLDAKAIMELTQKETDMLATIIQAGAEGIEKDTLLEQVWGYHQEAKSRTVEAHLYRLRQKLSDIAPHFPNITVEGGKCILSPAYSP